MVNFGLLTAEICWRVWGTPANFNEFRILAALLHGTLAVSISQTLGRWTEGAPYIWQGGHHVGQWPTFLVIKYYIKLQIRSHQCGQWITSRSLVESVRQLCRNIRAPPRTDILSLDRSPSRANSHLWECLLMKWRYTFNQCIRWRLLTFCAAKSPRNLELCSNSLCNLANSNPTHDSAGLSTALGIASLPLFSFASNFLVTTVCFPTFSLHFSHSVAKNILTSLMQRSWAFCWYQSSPAPSVCPLCCPWYRLHCSVGPYLKSFTFFALFFILSGSVASSTTGVGAKTQNLSYFV